jgi:hypothetical protein
MATGPTANTSLAIYRNREIAIIGFAMIGHAAGAGDPFTERATPIFGAHAAQRGLAIGPPSSRRRG